MSYITQGDRLSTGQGNDIQVGVAEFSASIKARTGSSTQACLRLQRFCDTVRLSLLHRCASVESCKLPESLWFRDIVISNLQLRAMCTVMYIPSSKIGRSNQNQTRCIIDRLSYALVVINMCLVACRDSQVLGRMRLWTNTALDLALQVFLCEAKLMAAYDTAPDNDVLSRLL